MHFYFTVPPEGGLPMHMNESPCMCLTLHYKVEAHNLYKCTYAYART